MINYQNMGNIGNDYKINAQIYLKGEYTDYWADIIVYYILRNYDDWTIDVIETNKMEIVKTDKYWNFIEVWRRSEGPGYYYFDIYNKSDVALLIGGVEHLVGSGGWRKISREVKAQGKETIGGWGYPGPDPKINDFEGHFVERP